MDDEWYTYLYSDDWEEDYPDEYEEAYYDNHYQTWGLRYHLRNRIYRIKWWFWRHFGRCKTCGKRNVKCTCVPF